MNNEKIIAKIKKCMKLAASSSPHEASLALQRVQEMMAKYSISKTSVEEMEESDFKVVDQRVSSIATATKVKPWESRLVHEVADAFGCEVAFAPGYPYGSYALYGVAEEAEAAALTVKVLQRQLRSGKARYADSLRGRMTRKMLTRELDEYCLGWASGAGENLKTLAAAKEQAAREADAKNCTTTAMTVVSNETKKQNAIAKFKDDRTAGRTSTNQGRRGRGSSLSGMLGYQDGQKSSLSSTLKASKQPKKSQKHVGAKS